MFGAAKKQLSYPLIHTYRKPHEYNRPLPPNLLCNPTVATQLTDTQRMTVYFKL